MNGWSGALRALLVGLCLGVWGAGPGTLAAPQGYPLYPDLRTVVPLHLGLQNQQQQEILRFSNGIANVGAGPLRF